MEKSIGLIELSSVASGFEVADTMLKAGNVRLLLSRSICSGKYMVLIGGDTAAVEAAVAAGAEAANGCLIDQFVISNVHPDVFVALGRTQPVQPDGALGILESFNVATLIEAADAAAKAANVTLLEVRLAMALGGKAFCTMTGDVASVQAAVAAGRQVITEAGVLVNAVVISRPHPDVYREVDLNVSEFIHCTSDPDLLRPELLHELFEQQAEARPDSIALVCGGQRMTYGELERRANQLARFLRSRGVRRGDCVGLWLPRSMDAYVALLGILKAGAAYVPLDPEYPAERVGFILSDCQARALVTTSELAAKVGQAPRPSPVGTHAPSHGEGSRAG